MRKSKKGTTASKQELEVLDDSIESRFVDVGDVEDHLRMLIYGRSGTGKTHFLGTAPKPLLLLDVRDKGTKTIKYSPDVKVLAVRQWSDLEDVYWYLEGPGKGKFATVAIDTLSQLQDMAIKSVRGNDDGMISRRVWGETSSLMKTWLMLYRDLEMNVLYTAQDRADSVDDVDEDGAILPEIGPYLMPSTAKIINAAVDVIGNTFIRERDEKVKLKNGKTRTKTVTEFCMRLGPHARYTTKMRRDSSLGGEGVPSIVVNPTIAEILKISLGGK